ncbi:MAG: TVP38/TMEM64 family protein [Solirubrobacterales bacterium]
MASTAEDDAVASPDAADTPISELPMRRAHALVAFAVGIAVLAALLALPSVREALGYAIRGDLGELRRETDAMGAMAAVVLVGLVLVHAIVPFPAELPTAVAGFVFGVTVGLPLMLGAWVASALLGYVLAIVAGRPVIERFIGAERLRWAEVRVERAGIAGLIVARLVPFFPFTLISFACGAVHVPLWRFAWTTFVGIIPLMTISTIFGARLQEPSLTDPLLWGTLGGLIVLVVASRPLIKRLRVGPETDATAR